MLVEMYREKSGSRRQGPALILFRDWRTGHYSDGGGAIDAGQTAMQAAQRELKEESIGLFRVDLGKCRVEDTVTIRGSWGAFVAFVVRVVGPRREGIVQRRYYENLEVSQSLRGLPSCWKETTGMTRFFVDDLAAAASLVPRGDLRDVPDVYGELHVVDARVRAVFVQALAQGLLGPFDSADANELRLAEFDATRGLGEAHSGSWEDSRGKTHVYWK
jgi:hypothetical protein